MEDNLTTSNHKHGFVVQTWTRFSQVLVFGFLGIQCVPPELFYFAV